MGSTGRGRSAARRLHARLIIGATQGPNSCRFVCVIAIAACPADILTLYRSADNRIAITRLIDDFVQGESANCAPYKRRFILSVAKLYEIYIFKVSFFWKAQLNIEY
jgi:hypothetical protein